MDKRRNFIGALLALATVGTFQHCIAADGTTAPLMARALAASRNHKPDEAIKLLRQYLTAHPRSANGYFDLAIIQNWDKHDYSAAETSIKHALRLDPNRYEYHWEYSTVLMNQERFKEARSVLDRAIKLPRNPAKDAQLKDRIRQLDQYLSQKS